MPRWFMKKMDFSKATKFAVLHALFVADGESKDGVTKVLAHFQKEQTNQSTPLQLLEMTTEKNNGSNNQTRQFQWSFTKVPTSAFC